MAILSYVPFHELGDRPNIIVDGSGNDNTVLTLSHWPGNTTPDEFKDDLSASIVFNFLEKGELPEDVSVVSNNHFDEDGLVSVYSMINPEKALSMKDFLIDLASAGDFGTFHDRDAARVKFVLSAWMDPERSPLSKTIFGGTYDELNKVLYEELLVRLPKIIAKIDNFQPYWQDDDDFLTITEEAIEKGKISVEQDRDLDLAIVTVADDALDESYAPQHAPSWTSQTLSPMALHNKIDCHAVALLKGRRYEFYYRYETWVEFVSRKLQARVDLSGLARELTEKEKGPATWKFNGVDAIVARLSLTRAAESSHSPDQFVDYLKASLSAGQKSKH